MQISCKVSEPPLDETADVAPFEDDVHADIDVLGVVRGDSSDLAVSSIDDPSERSEKESAAGVSAGKEEVMARFMQSEAQEDLDLDGN